MGTGSSTALDLFVSYAHADDGLRKELEKHLVPLVRDRVVTQWHDRLIGAGDDWREVIETQLSTADIIVLLISSDFMASEFCMDVELKRALQRHESAEAVLIPVILRPVDWQSSVFGSLQALPQDGKPITKYVERDEGFAEVAKGIRNAAQRLSDRRQMQPVPSTSLKILYRDLLDPKLVTRTGDTLRSALSAPGMRGTVQPFLEPYSELIPAALEMMIGEMGEPHSTVVCLFPLGDKEPAWVQLLRCGRIHVTTNRAGHVRVFLGGDDPKKAYLNSYSIVRHCLATLADLFGAALQVDIYAYINDFSQSEIHVNTLPYSFTSKTFDREKTKVGVDLQQLQKFFESGAEIQGGVLQYGSSLDLRGKAGPKQTVAGEPLSLSDLAVAYRAVFHAGSNAAFVSLDQNQDPTKVTVNFGGHLENTRLGHVLLEADKRFKTISHGIDPNSLKDDRLRIRNLVNAFLTSDERGISEDDRNGKIGGRATIPLSSLKGMLQHFLGLADKDIASETGLEWISTRFWYYPDDVVLDADGEFETATIVSARFKADAERSRDDFADSREYQKHKREMLLTSHRKNIDDLNRQYDKYSKAFPELAELDVVARLLGICVWISRRNPAWLDCDELLTTEVEPFKTETEQDRLIAATLVSSTSATRPSEIELIEDSVVVLLTPMLNWTLAEFRRSVGDAAEWSKVPASITWRSVFISDDEFDRHKQRTVREFIKSEDDLRMFTTIAAHTLPHPKSRVLAEIEESLLKSDAKLDELSAMISATDQQIKDTKARMSVIRAQIEASVSRGTTYGQTEAKGAGSEDEYWKGASSWREHYEEHNRLVRLHTTMLAEEASLSEAYDMLIKRRDRFRTWRAYGISGGIDATPADFSCEINPSSEPLIAFKERIRKVRATYTEMSDGERWIGTESKPVSPTAITPNMTSLAKMAQSIKVSLHRGSGRSWQVIVERDGQRLQERRYDSDKGEVQIIYPLPDGRERILSGRRIGSGEVHFSRAVR